MLPHASPAADEETASVGRIHPERGDTSHHLDLDHYTWTPPTPELTKLHRSAYWKFSSNNYSDAEHRFQLDAECLVCHHPVHRMHAVHNGYLVVSSWRHEYGAGHPAAVEEN